MMIFRTAIALALALPASASSDTASLNPIRKVVKMLQAMQKKIEKEGTEESEAYKKFMCYCKTNGADLSGTIAVSTDKVPAVSSNIDASEAKLSQSKSDLSTAQNDRASAKQAIASATALREKEAAAYAALKSDYDANILAINKAVTSLEKGVAGNFLQTPDAQIVRRALSNVDLPEADLQEVASFLSQKTEYAPQSGEIIGILKQMGGTMGASLADATKIEEDSIATYKGLMAAKKKEISALTAVVEAKTALIGKLGVAIVNLKNDLSDTEAALAADKSFLASLETGCATKTSEWEARSKTRAEELVTIADTIKVLNDDDALELFKKTLPSAAASSLVQVENKRVDQKRRALAVVKSAQKTADNQNQPGLAMLAMALAGTKSASKGGFEKVIAMIDDMVAMLKTEQQGDDNKKEYCSLQFDHTEDKMKALDQGVKGKSQEIAEGKDAIATLTDEIGALNAGIAALDKAVADATSTRKEENTAYKALMASNTAAKQLLDFAKNRLNKFYNKALYKAPPSAELSAEDHIYSNLGGEVTTAAPGGIADTGVTVLAQVSEHRHVAAPPPPPSTWDAYSSKSGQGVGVIAMIDLLIKDLEKEMTEAVTEEKDSQADYEEQMRLSASKRMTDSASLTEKGGAKADLEVELQADMESKSSLSKQFMATSKYNSNLHTECDWLLKYFDTRKEARAGEVDSLKNAKAVLSGADLSLVQKKKGGFLRHA